MKIGDKLIATGNLTDPTNRAIFLFTKNVTYIIKGFTVNGYLITSNNGIITVTLELLKDCFILPTNDTFNNFDYAMGVL